MRAVWLLLVPLSFTLGCASALSPYVVNYGRINREEPSPRFAGTGFVWGGRYVLTAAHALPNDHPTVIVPTHLLSSRSIPGEVVLRESDIALIRLGIKQDLPSLELAPIDLLPGERVRILDGAYGSSIVLEATAVYPDSVRLDGLFDTIGDGSSGSPVVNERNQVVGIVFGSIHAGGERLVSLYAASEIRRALSLHRQYWPIASR